MAIARSGRSRKTASYVSSGQIYEWQDGAYESPQSLATKFYPGTPKMGQRFLRIILASSPMPPRSEPASPLPPPRCEVRRARQFDHSTPRFHPAAMPLTKAQEMRSHNCPTTILAATAMRRRSA